MIMNKKEREKRLWDIAQAMIIDGGSFAKLIGEAYQMADIENKRILSEAFENLFKESSYL